MFRDSQKLCLRQHKLRKQRETLHGRECHALRGQIFPLNLLSSNRSRTRTCNFRKMSRMYNAVGAPGEFFPPASIEKRQVIYLSKLIQPTCKTPG